MEVTEVRSLNPPPGGPPSPPGQSGGGGYTLPAARFSSEDILFCIDVGPESMVEMKVNGPNGRPYTRLDSIKQAILLFVHAKLTINPDHRFAFAALSKTTYWVLFNPEVICYGFLQMHLPSWIFEVYITCCIHYAFVVFCSNMLFHLTFEYSHRLKWLRKQINSISNAYHSPGDESRKEFSSEVDSAIAALRGISVDSSSNHADLTQLFRVIHAATISVASDSKTLHLGRYVSEFEGYIFESGQGLTRALFRHMCVLLSHPQQRCIQDELDIPKPLIKKSPVADTSQGDDSVVITSQ
ncbi:hypothetical protein DH2020_025492 [Rehmannia glutinosa]|uniref:BRISC and BRCA1-A complex member 1 n=1 Tax=Rehmannia glutinosa TaxID=99300 RepID=A0ABR0VZL7_REHGL